MDSPATRAIANQKLARIRQNNERTENPQAKKAQRRLTVGLERNARTLLSFLRLLRFPGLEFGPFGTTLSLFFLDRVERFLLIRLEHCTNVSLGFLATGSHLIFQRLLIGWRQFLQVLLHQLFASVHLAANQFADLLALFAAQVQLAVRAFAVHLMAAPMLAAFRATHRATTFRHGHGDGGQGGGEHQSDKGLAHGESPCLVPGTFRMSTDYGDQGQRRSAERKAWVKTVLSDPDKSRYRRQHTAPFRRCRV